MESPVKEDGMAIECCDVFETIPPADNAKEAENCAASAFSEFPEKPRKAEKDLFPQLVGQLRLRALISAKVRETVTFVQCDSEINRVEEYRRPLKNVVGRGGTSFCPPFETEFLLRHRPDVIVYFTDGCGPAPEKPPRIPVFWCLTPGQNAPAAWGRVLRLDEHREKG